MRDHTKLRAFELADRLVVEVYRASRHFPRTEAFGLTSQLRRAVVSIASNIVEGCARHTQADYVRFPDAAYGSAREVEYQVPWHSAWDRSTGPTWKDWTRRARRRAKS